MPAKFIPLSEELTEYVAAHGSPRDEALLETERATEALGDIAVMQTSPEQAALLELLVRLSGTQRAIEVGTFTGYGAIRIARGLPAEGTLVLCELEQRWADVALANLESAGVRERVEMKVGPALETLRSLPAEPSFGFAYLDADKTGYPGYYEELLLRLAPGGLLVMDNVLLGGRVLDPGDDSARTMAKLNDAVAADERVDAVMLAVADGLSLVRKR